MIKNRLLERYFFEEYNTAEGYLYFLSLGLAFTISVGFPNKVDPDIHTDNFNRIALFYTMVLLTGNISMKCLWDAELKHVVPWNGHQDPQI